MLWLISERNLGIWARGDLRSREVFDLADSRDQDLKVCCGILLCLNTASIFYEGELGLSSIDAIPFREGGWKGMCDFSVKWNPWGRKAYTSGGCIGNILSVIVCKYYFLSPQFIFSIIVLEWCFLQLHVIFCIQVLAQEQWRIHLRFSSCSAKWLATHSLAQLRSYVKDVLPPSLLQWLV